MKSPYLALLAFVACSIFSASIVVAESPTPTPVPTPVRNASLCLYGAPVPSDVVLVTDMSGSMNGDKSEQARQSATAFVRQMNPNDDRAALIVFSSYPQTVYTFSLGLNEAVTATLDMPFVGDGTDIEAALRTAIDLLARDGRGAPAAQNIVLLSDGQSYVNPLVLSNARTKNIRIFTIALGADADIAAMRQYASKAAYAYVSPRPEDLPRIYAEIHQLSLCPDPPPAWLCLLPLLLLPFLVALLWRNRNSAAASWQPAPSMPFSATQIPSLQPLATPPVAAGATVTPRMAIAASRPAIVIGIGKMGADVLDAIQATLREMLDDGRDASQRTALTCCAVQIGEPSRRSGRLTIDVPPADPMGPQPGWSVAVPDDGSISRTQARLALWQQTDRVSATLGDILSTGAGQVASESGRSPTVNVYLVASLAEAEGSALTADVAHLLKLAAETKGVTITVQGLLTLVEPSPTTASDFGENLACASAWRELDRWQCANTPAPIDSAGHADVRTGHLFDRLYLISPDVRGLGASIGADRHTGLCPLLADIIFTQQDDAFCTDWDEYARNVQTRLAGQQAQTLTPYYSSLGAYTYILPIEEITRYLQARLGLCVAQLQTRLRALSLDDEIASLLTAQSVRPTNLAQHLVRNEPNRGLSLESLAEMLSPAPETAAERECLDALYSLRATGVTNRVRISENARARHYGQDSNRVMVDTDRISQDRAVDPHMWLEQCRAIQADRIGRLIEEYLTRSLNAANNQPAILSPSEARAVMLRLVERIRAHRDAVTIPAQNAVPISARQGLENATRLPGGFPALMRALMPTGISILVAIVVVTLVYLVWPAFETPVLVTASLVVLAGFAGSVLATRTRPAAHHRQLDFLTEAQQNFTYRIEADIKAAFVATLDDCAARAQQVADWLHDWLAALDTSTRALSERLDTLRVERDKRAQIKVRHYLEDEALLAELDKRWVDETAVQAANAAFRWLAAGAVSPGLPVIKQGQLAVRLDAETSRPVAPTVEDVLRALDEAALPYASRVRRMLVIDVLRDYYTPAMLARECSDHAQPWIETRANEQPHSEFAQRLACRWADDRASLEFARDTLACMVKPLATRVTQQDARLAHPQRCVVLSVLDVINPSGIVHWDAVRRPYDTLTTSQRAEQHVYAAEQCAIRHEAAMSSLLSRKVTLSPWAALLHSDVNRLRAFCLAAALRWLVEGEQRQGATYLRYWHIRVPDGGEATGSLNKPQEFAPSLYDAAAAFVVVAGANEVARVQQSVDAALNTGGDRERQDQLEDQLIVVLRNGAPARKPYASQAVEAREQEVVNLIRAYAADELRVLSGASRKMAGFTAHV